jgi:DNA-binding response OmpR family regulator
MPPGVSGLELTVGATLLLHKPISPHALVAHADAILAGNPGTTSTGGPAT